MCTVYILELPERIVRMNPVCQVPTHRHGAARYMFILEFNERIARMKPVCQVPTHRVGTVRYTREHGSWIPAQRKGNKSGGAWLRETGTRTGKS